MDHILHLDFSVYWVCYFLAPHTHVLLGSGYCDQPAHAVLLLFSVTNPVNLSEGRPILLNINKITGMRNLKLLAVMPGWYIDEHIRHYPDEKLWSFRVFFSIQLSLN